MKIRKQTRKKIVKLSLCLALLSFLFLMNNLNSVKAADGAAGSIEVSVDSLTAGTPLTVHCYDLTDGADYLVNHTNDDTGYSFTADGTEWQITIPNIESPSSGNTVTFYLRAQSAGTSLDSTSVVVNEMSDFYPIGLIITIGIVAIILGFVTTMIVKKKFF